MSVFLVVALSLLFAGVLATLIIAWYRPRHAFGSATIVVVIEVVLWLVMRASLPHQLSLINGLAGDQLPLWTLYVDGVAWQSSFYLMLLMLAVLLVSQSGLDGLQTNRGWPLSPRFGPSAGLFLMTSTLLALWSGSPYALLQGWMLLVLAWLLVLSTAEEACQAIGITIFKATTLLLALLFLWLAVASLPDAREASLNAADWPPPARTWVLLAALVQLGALPLHWWRPLSWSLSPATGALVHIAPALVGGTLLARPVLSGAGDLGYSLYLTLFGLLGLFAGAVLAWSHIGRPALMAASLALGQVGIVLLVGAWTGTEAVLAETRVLTLAVGGMFLANSLPKARTGWYTIALAAVLAGLPLTAGFLGLSALYNAWLVNGRGILVLITTLLHVPIIAAVLLIGFRQEQHEDGRNLAARSKLLQGLGLTIPILGLLALPTVPAAQVNLLSWLAILLSAAAGVVLALRSEQLPEMRQILRGALHFDLPREQLQRAYLSISSAGGTVIREAAAILEGEGGMLWLLVLLVILWLARQG